MNSEKTDKQVRVSRCLNCLCRDGLFDDAGPIEAFLIRRAGHSVPAWLGFSALRESISCMGPGTISPENMSGTGGEESQTRPGAGTEGTGSLGGSWVKSSCS